MADNYFGITDTGKVRSNNEDTFIVQTFANDRFIVACVIDGVGGYAGGEVAARIAHDAILEHLKNKPDDLVGLMKSAIGAANEAIYNEKMVNKANEQMACVLTLAIVDISNNKFYYSHVGDTRLYLYRDQSLVKITRDHSFVGFVEDSGRLSEEAAMRHPKRNEINKALGFDAYIRVDDYIETGESPFLPGDSILLCSDGLSDMIGNSAMSAILNSNKNLSAKAKSLVQAANEAGGKDNITVVLVHNNNRPVKLTATKPVVSAKTNDVSEEKEVVLAKISTLEERSIVQKKKRRSILPFLTFLGILILAALGWILYQEYKNENLHDQHVQSALNQKKERSSEEQNFIDSINNNKTNEVFVLATPGTKPVIITDSILINRDSLHIIGNGLTLISDTSYKGAALTVGPNCKYLLVDSVTFENFDIGVLTKSGGLHFRRVQFKNCRVPVQYDLMFKDRPVINGRFADTVFYNSDSIQF
jgi:serine/threonine protein phosphatase PrpC